MKRMAFLICLCLCLILGACFATAGAEGVTTISTKEDLLAFAQACETKTFAGEKVVLANDINLGGAEWTPIKSFAGEFDGNGKTISNFKPVTRQYQLGENTWQVSGFFRDLINSAYVHNLTLQDVTATIDSGRFATLAYDVYYIWSSVRVEDVTVRNVNVTVNDTSAWVGGMIGRANKPIKNCKVENLTVTAPKGIFLVGGFVAVAENKYDAFENCTVSGFKLTAKAVDNFEAGGFAARTQTLHNFIDFKDCHVTGLDFNITGDAKNVSLSGFAGYMGANTNGYNCEVKGKIKAENLTNPTSHIGGFMVDMGWGEFYSPYDHYTYQNCIADVDIIADGATVGGFIANSTNDHTRTAVFENCTAKGDVTSPNGIVGGFAGTADRGTFTNCKATGLVTGKIAGGFIGEVRDLSIRSISVDQCSAVGTVLGSEKAGGLIGNMGAAVENGTVFTIKSSTAAPAVIGANKDTQVDSYLNSVANSKATKMEGLRGQRTTANPTDGSKTLAMDQNGDVTIPEGGANVEHTDDPELEWIPAGSIIHRDGSITLPGANTTPPKTGVDGVEGYAALALASLLCAAALVVLRRRTAR